MSETQKKRRITAEDIVRAQAVDPVALAGKYLKLEKRGRLFFALCPFHKDTRPSFKIERGRKYHCFPCGAHLDTIEFVQRMENIDFVAAVELLAGESFSRMRLRVVATNKRPETIGNAEAVKARGIWHQGSGIMGTAVETHLRQRGISIFPETVRAIPNYNWFADLVLPVMVVAIQGPSGIVIGVQLTALTLSGTRKAFAERSRRTEGVLGAGAARFAGATDVLGLSEGAEKAIAAQELTGVPTWASLGAGRMQNVSIPDAVRELHIFADDDAPGREAAERTAQRQKHRRVIVRLPPEGCKDWDDVLRARRL